MSLSLRMCYPGFLHSTVKIRKKRRGVGIGLDFKVRIAERIKTNLLELRLDPSLICSQVSRKASFLPGGRGFGDGDDSGGFPPLRTSPHHCSSHPAPPRWSSQGWREDRMPMGGGRLGGGSLLVTHGNQGSF